MVSEPSQILRQELHVSGFTSVSSLTQSIHGQAVACTRTARLDWVMVVSFVSYAVVEGGGVAIDNVHSTSG